MERRPRKRNHNYSTGLTPGRAQHPWQKSNDEKESPEETRPTAIELLEQEPDLWGQLGTEHVVPKGVPLEREGESESEGGR